MKLEKLSCPSCGGPITGEVMPNQQIECPHCSVQLMMSNVDTDTPIFCRNCRTLNSDEVRHCVRCGKSLQVMCSACQTYNRIDANHCIFCGAHLQTARRRRHSVETTRQLEMDQRMAALQKKRERQKTERLHRLLNELAEPKNHEFALYQIKQLGADAINGLNKAMLTHRDPDTRYGAAQALAAICHEHDINPVLKSRVVKALIKALQDDEPLVRFWAADSLGHIGHPLAVEPLGELLHDRHADIRDKARDALRNIGGDQARDILAQNKGLFGWLKG